MLETQQGTRKTKAISCPQGRQAEGQSLVNDSCDKCCRGKHGGEGESPIPGGLWVWAGRRGVICLHSRQPLGVDLGRTHRTVGRFQRHRLSELEWMVGGAMVAPPPPPCLDSV